MRWRPPPSKRVYGEPLASQASFQGRSFRRTEVQAGADEGLTLRGDAGPKLEDTGANVTIVFIRNVPTDHVVQENAHGPHFCAFAIVSTMEDPFRRAVDSCTWKRKKRRIKLNLRQ